MILAFIEKWHSTLEGLEHLPLLLLLVVLRQHSVSVLQLPHRHPLQRHRLAEASRSERQLLLLLPRLLQLQQQLHRLVVLVDLLLLRLPLLHRLLLQGGSALVDLARRLRLPLLRRRRLSRHLSVSLRQRQPRLQPPPLQHRPFRLQDSEPLLLQHLLRLQQLQRHRFHLRRRQLLRLLRQLLAHHRRPRHQSFQRQLCRRGLLPR